MTLDQILTVLKAVALTYIAGLALFMLVLLSLDCYRVAMTRRTRQLTPISTTGILSSRLQRDILEALDNAERKER
ncbi:hypothetical protein [Dictyobacter formicarum]|uniref:Uncharacterized protein n=1 Tax=Dictyobacter formicarum TaxID=2778368 RepID=A0ABQ3VR58_9CHLR|nr:hypothetical protein [Dictyobacter formicarum]GHO88179.1 hypothetical protein KSZ_61850 [Dictyobacter formicarum]